MLILKEINGKITTHCYICFWQCEPDSGLEMFAFTPLIQNQNLRVETQREELLGKRNKGIWSSPHRHPHMPRLVAISPFAGSSVSVGLCLLLIAQISENESQHVQASGADGICGGQLAEKSFQRKIGTSDRWKSGKLIKMFQGKGKGEVGKKKSFPTLNNKRTFNE